MALLPQWPVPRIPPSFVRELHAVLTQFVTRFRSITNAFTAIENNVTFRTNFSSLYSGAYGGPVRLVVGTTTVGYTDSVILANAVGTAFSVALRPAIDYEGLVFVIKKIGNATTTVLVTGTIDGATNYSLTVTNQSITVVAGTTSWWIL